MVIEKNEIHFGLFAFALHPNPAHCIFWDWRTVLSYDWPAGTNNSAKTKIRMTAIGTLWTSMFPVNELKTGPWFLLQLTVL